MNTNELLRRYVDARSEPAFEELVRQHIDLVYSSALRQVNGDVPAAQDVTQAVFTELARNAPRLIRHTSLAGWLYTSTRYLAAKALRAEQRRRSREQEAYEMNKLLHSTELDTAWEELRPLLDDAMHDLSAADREAVLMRYFERLTLADIGARLGLKENAAHMRIERAIDRLRAALAKRGVTSTVTALSAVLTGRAVSGAPAGLVSQVSRSAFKTAAAGSGLGWALLKLAGLMNGKLVVAGGGAALLASLILVPQFLTKSSESPSKNEISSETSTQAAGNGAPSVSEVAGSIDPSSTNNSAASNGLVLRVVANDTGKPIAGATLISWFHENNASNGPSDNKEITADKLGVCEIPVSRGDIALLGFGSRTDGFVDTAYVWQPEHGETIPRQYTLRLDTAVPIGGQVVDESAKPIAGAAVTVWLDANAVRENDSYPPHVSTAAQETKLTDAEGRWRIARFSKKTISTLNIEVKHPDYIAELGVAYMNDNNPVSEQPLLAGTYVYKLHRGLPVSGIVVDSDGQPISGAKVTAIATGGSAKLTKSLSDGTFVLRGVKGGANQITAEAPGFGLATVNVEITNNQPPLRLELTRGNILRLRVVDINGKPVPNAAVSLSINRPGVRARFGRLGGPGQFRRQTDANGQVSWEGAPEGELLLNVVAAGYEWAQNVEASADGQEHLVTLRAARVISGNVLDGALNQPISNFRIVTGEMGSPESPYPTNVQWEKTQIFHDGTFRFDDDDPGVGTKKYKIQADGYAPFITREVGTNEGNVSFDIVLYPAAGTTISILLPDGRPATNAFIGLDMPGTFLDLKPGGLGPTPQRFSADDAGHFVLPPDDSVTRVIAASPEGYAESTPGALTTNSTMRLQPWGRLEGTIFSGGKPAIGQVLAFRFVDAADFFRLRFFRAKSDADGHFDFPKVPPGQFNLFRVETREMPRGTATMPRPIQDAAVAVQLGKTTTVSLTLYEVTAQLSLPPGVEMNTNWTISATASRTEDVAGLEESEPLKESGDGTWVAGDLPAGNYTLEASVADSTQPGEDSKVHMKATMSFTIPGISQKGTLDLGKTVLQPVQ